MIAGSKKTYTPINREDIHLTDVDLMRRYLGIDKFPCKLSSPLREDDDRPSFSMRESGGVVFWKDFGTGDGGTAISLLSKLWHSTYHETLLRIKEDTESKIPMSRFVRKIKGSIHIIHDSTVNVVVRKWKDWDVEFWKSFGISQAFATWCNVFPVSHAIFTKTVDGKKQTTTVPLDKYAYAYFEWKDGNRSVKLYQPYSTTMKWLSKHDASVWDLWKQAFDFAKYKSNDNIIITSSRKDAMCLWYNLNIPAIAMQGEGYLPKPQVMQQIFDTFSNVYLWYDNDFSHKEDNPGQDNAKKLLALYPSLKNICIPKEFQCKDPSDFYKKYGQKQLRKLWTSINSV